jgi:hypothetical protein
MSNDDYQVDQLAELYFADCEEHREPVGPRSFTAWLWFSCPAALRRRVADAIRSDPRWCEPESE